MFNPNNHVHRTAVFQALFVTFLWSTSWILIKIGLRDDLHPLIFAGLRYFLAFLVLFSLLLHYEGRAVIGHLNRSAWLGLIFLGVIYYAITQGAQFVSLAYLPAVTANLILGFTPVVVAFLGLLFLSERPSTGQWIGIALSAGGVALYFYPVDLSVGSGFGLLIAIVGMMANAGSSLWGRHLNRSRLASPLVITTLSMGVGAFLLLIGGIWFDGFPRLSGQTWVLIFWLALVNTALAFTLWNHTLRTLSAMESSIINNTMAVQIPLLAVVFLGERLTLRQWIGLGTVIAGVFFVQLARSKK